MKKVIISLVVMFAVAGASLVFAQPAAVAKIEVGNKICPVSGEKVGEMGDIVKYEYKGKIYNFCCEACLKDFVKNPEKFAKIAEDEVAASQVTK